jgi:hypothetical protein
MRRSAGENLSRVRRLPRFRSDQPHLGSAGLAIRDAPPRLALSSMNRKSLFHVGELKRVRRNTDAESAFRVNPAAIRCGRLTRRDDGVLAVDPQARHQHPVGRRGRQ